MQGFDLRQLVELIQTARFAIYRVDEQCSPTTFLTLGMSIGLNCPFIMINQKGNEVPLNLRGLGIYQFANYVELERDVVTWHKKFFDKYVQREHKGQAGSLRSNQHNYRQSFIGHSRGASWRETIDEEPARNSKPVRIFISYAYEDKQYLDQLRRHLRQLERQEHIEIWHDGNIGPGTHLRTEIDKHLVPPI
jgi:hypothetical protein